MIDTERKEDLFLDTKLIKSENRLGKLRIIDELHPVLGGQPTHEADQPNDNNPFLDLACTMQFTIDKVNEVDKKADTKLAKAQNLKDVANVAIARDNLGLGTSATMNATSTLSDRTDQTGTIKVVNDVNRAANNAQTSANNANNKANAAQTRADSAYNLASRKRDVTDNYFSSELLVSSGDVFLRGSYKGESFFSISVSNGDRASLNSYPNGKYQSNRLPEKPGTLAIQNEVFDRLEKSQNLKDLENVEVARDNLGLGTSATMNATSTLSDRTDQTATIKVVNDVNQKIVGVDQKWVDVTAQRALDTFYNNTSNKVVFISVEVASTSSGAIKAQAILKSGVVIGGVTRAEEKNTVTKTLSLFTAVMPGDEVKISFASAASSPKLTAWSETQ